MSRKKDTGGVRLGDQSATLCQTARGGVRCRRLMRWIVGWPQQMGVCGVCHNVLKRLRDRLEREQKATKRELVVRTPRGTREWAAFRDGRGTLAVRLVSKAPGWRRRNKPRELHYDAARKEFWFRAVTAGVSVRATFIGDTAKQIRKRFPTRRAA